MLWKFLKSISQPTLENNPAGSGSGPKIPDENKLTLWRFGQIA